jgi:ABC-type sugar transport system permease subunit
MATVLADRLSATRSWLKRRGVETPWSAIMVFLMPALAIYAAFTAYPVMRTFYNSVHKIRPRGADQ